MCASVGLLPKNYTLEVEKMVFLQRDSLVRVTGGAKYNNGKYARVVDRLDETGETVLLGKLGIYNTKFLQAIEWNSEANSVVCSECGDLLRVTGYTTVGDEYDDEEVLLLYDSLNSNFRLYSFENGLSYKTYEDTLELVNTFETIKKVGTKRVDCSDID